MVDLREAISESLLSVCGNVKMSRPDGDVDLPLICYAQTGNSAVSTGADRIQWRVAVYDSTFESLTDLVSKVDGLMCGALGYTRTGITPDDQARVGTDLYVCRLDYSALYNRAMRGIIRGSQ